MGEVRLSWALSLLDLPLSAVEHLVQNILVTGAGSIVRLPQGGPLDQQSAIHALTIWFRDHGKSFQPEVQRTIDGIISWLGCTDATSFPDLYSTAAGLIVLSYGSWDRKATLLFSLFGFGSGGPRPPQQVYQNKVEPAEEPLLAPDELALLLRSVCTGLYGIGLGSSFAPPGMDSLARIAADAMEQINSRGGERKRGLTKADFHVWVARSPDAVAGLERLSLLPRLRMVIQSIQSITDDLEKKLLGSADRLSKLPGAPAPRGTIHARVRAFSHPEEKKAYLDQDFSPLPTPRMKQDNVKWPLALISKLRHCDVELFVLLPPRTCGIISVTIHLTYTKPNLFSSQMFGDEDLGKLTADGCIVRESLSRENMKQGLAIMRLGELSPCTAYRMVLWYDDKPCPTSFPGCHSRCFTTLPPPPSWGHRSHWPQLPLRYSSTAASCLSPASSPLVGPAPTPIVPPMTPAWDSCHPRKVPYEVSFACAGMDLMRDHVAEDSDHQGIKPTAALRLVLGLPREDGDILIHRMFYCIEKTLRQHSHQEHNEFLKEDIDTAKVLITTVMTAAKQRCIGCAQASSYSSQGPSVDSERGECATMFLLSKTFPNEWKFRYPFTCSFLLKFLKKESNNLALQLKALDDNCNYEMNRSVSLKTNDKNKNKSKPTIDNSNEDEEEEDIGYLFFAGTKELKNPSEVEEAVEDEVILNSLGKPPTIGLAVTQCGPLTIVEIDEDEDDLELSPAQDPAQPQEPHGGRDMSFLQGMFSVMGAKETKDAAIEGTDLQATQRGGWDEQNIRNFLRGLNDDDASSLLFISPQPLITARPAMFNTKQTGWSLLTPLKKRAELASTQHDRDKEATNLVEEAQVMKLPDKEEVREVMDEMIQTLLLRVAEEEFNVCLSGDIGEDSDWMFEEDDSTLIPVPTGKSNTFDTSSSQSMTEKTKESNRSEQYLPILEPVKSCEVPVKLRGLKDNNKNLSSLVRILDRLLSWSAHGESVIPQQEKQHSLSIAQQTIPEDELEDYDEGNDHIDSHQVDDEVIGEFFSMAQTMEKLQNRHDHRNHREVVLMCYDADATDYHVELTFSRFMSADVKEGDEEDDDDEIERELKGQHCTLRVVVLAGGSNFIQDNVDSDISRFQQPSQNPSEEEEKTTKKSKAKESEEKDAEGDDELEETTLQPCPLSSADLAVWRAAVSALPQIGGGDKKIDIALRIAPACCDGKRMPIPWKIIIDPETTSAALSPPPYVLMDKKGPTPPASDAALHSNPSKEPFNFLHNLIHVGPIIGKVTSTSVVVVFEIAVDATAYFTFTPSRSSRKRQLRSGTNMNDNDIGEEEEDEAEDEDGDSDDSLDLDDDSDSDVEVESDYSGDEDSDLEGFSDDELGEFSEVLTFMLHLRKGKPGSIDCVNLQPGTCYRVDVKLLGEEINERMSSVPISSRQSSRPPSRMKDDVNENAGAAGSGGGVNDGLTFRHLATVRTDVNDNHSTSCSSLFGMSLCVTHDGIGRAALDHRSPSFIEALARHSAATFGDVFSANQQEAVHHKKSFGGMKRGMSVEMEAEEEEQRRELIRSMGTNSPPWHLSLHLGGQLDGKVVFAKASSYIRRVESLALRASPVESAALMKEAWEEVEHMYKEAYRRAWGAGDMGYDRGGVLGVSRYFAHGGGHLMIPSSLDITGSSNFGDESLLGPTDQKVAQIAWRVAGEYQGQTWGPLGSGPSWINPWASPDSKGQEGDGKVMKANHKNETHAQKRARIHAPPGCFLTSFGGGGISDGDVSSGEPKPNGVASGGMLLCGLSSRLTLYAPSDGAAAELLGSWLSTQLFDTAPEGHRLHGPTALVVSSDLPLVASSQTRPSPKVDQAGRRVSQTHSWLSRAPKCLSAITLCLFKWRRLHPLRSVFILSGGMGAYSGSVWTKLMPTVPDDWPAEWVTMMREPVMVCFRPPPLLSLPFQAAPIPPAVPSNASPPSSSSSTSTSSASASSAAVLETSPQIEPMPPNKLVSICHDAVSFVEGEDIMRPGGLLKHAFLLNEVGSVLLPDARPTRSTVEEEGESDQLIISLKWCHSTSLIDAGGHGASLAPNGSYAEVEVSRRLNCLGLTTKLPPKLKSFVADVDVRGSNLANLVYKGQEDVGGAYFKKLSHLKAENLVSSINDEQKEQAKKSNSETAAAAEEGDDDDDDSVAVDDLMDEQTKWFKKRKKLSKSRSDSSGMAMTPHIPELGDRNQGGFSIINICAPSADLSTHYNLRDKPAFTGGDAADKQPSTNVPSPPVSAVPTAGSGEKQRPHSSPHVSRGQLQDNHTTTNKNNTKISETMGVTSEGIVACFGARTIGGRGAASAGSAGAYSVLGPIIGEVESKAVNVLLEPSCFMPCLTATAISIPTNTTAYALKSCSLYNCEAGQPQSLRIDGLSPGTLYAITVTPLGDSGGAGSILDMIGGAYGVNWVRTKPKHPGMFRFGVAVSGLTSHLDDIASVNTGASTPSEAALDHLRRLNPPAYRAALGAYHAPVDLGGGGHLTSAAWKPAQHAQRNIATAPLYLDGTVLLSGAAQPCEVVTYMGEDRKPARVFDDVFDSPAVSAVLAKMMKKVAVKWVQKKIASLERKDERIKSAAKSTDSKKTKKKKKQGKNDEDDEDANRAVSYLKKRIKDTKNLLKGKQDAIVTFDLMNLLVDTLCSDTAVSGILNDAAAETYRNEWGGVAEVRCFMSSNHGGIIGGLYTPYEVELKERVGSKHASTTHPPPVGPGWPLGNSLIWRLAAKLQSQFLIFVNNEISRAAEETLLWSTGFVSWANRFMNAKLATVSTPVVSSDAGGVYNQDEDEETQQKIMKEAIEEEARLKREKKEKEKLMGSKFRPPTLPVSSLAWVLGNLFAEARGVAWLQYVGNLSGCVGMTRRAQDEGLVQTTTMPPIALVQNFPPIFEAPKLKNLDGSKEKTKEKKKEETPLILRWPSKTSICPFPRVISSKGALTNMPSSMYFSTGSFSYHRYGRVGVLRLLVDPKALARQPNPKRQSQMQELAARELNDNKKSNKKKEDLNLDDGLGGMWFPLMADEQYVLMKKALGVGLKPNKKFKDEIQSLIVYSPMPIVDGKFDHASPDVILTSDSVSVNVKPATANKKIISKKNKSKPTDEMHQQGSIVNAAVAKEVGEAGEGETKMGEREEEEEEGKKGAKEDVASGVVNGEEQGEASVSKGVTGKKKGKVSPEDKQRLLMEARECEAKEIAEKERLEGYDSFQSWGDWPDEQRLLLSVLFDWLDNSDAKAREKKLSDMRKANQKLLKDRAKKQKVQKMRDEEKKKEKADKKAAKKKKNAAADEEEDGTEAAVAQQSAEDKKGAEEAAEEEDDGVPEDISVGFSDRERLSQLSRRACSFVCGTTAARSSHIEVFDGATLQTAQQITVSTNYRYHHIVSAQTCTSPIPSGPFVSLHHDASTTVVSKSNQRTNSETKLPPLPHYWDECIDPTLSSAERRTFKVKSLRFTPLACPVVASVSTALDFHTSASLTLMLEPTPYHVNHKSVLVQELESVSPSTLSHPSEMTAPSLEDPPLIPGAVCYGLLGPVLGAIEPEINELNQGIGIWTAESEVSAVEAAGLDAVATFSIRVLFEVDRPAWLSCSATDVLQGRGKVSSQSGAFIRTRPRLLQGRGKPHVFVLKGLKPLRRYRIRIEGVTDSEDRCALLHTPPPPGSWTELNVITLSRENISGNLTPSIDPVVDESVNETTGLGGEDEKLAKDGTSERLGFTLFGEVAERLSVPWHGIDLCLHLGGVVDMREPLQEAIAWIVASKVDESNPYAFGASDSASPQGIAATSAHTKFSNTLTEFFAEPIRRAWANPSLKRILATCPQLVLPGNDDMGIEAVARMGVLDSLRKQMIMKQHRSTSTVSSGAATPWGLEVEVGTLRACHMALSALKKVQRLFLRSLCPPTSMNPKHFPIATPIDLGFSGDSAPFHGKPLIQLYFGGKVAILGLDLWGSNTGKKLDIPPPPTIQARQTASHRAGQSAVANAQAATLAARQKDIQSKLSPAEVASRASAENGGMLGPQQWTCILNLLAGHDPYPKEKDQRTDDLEALKKKHIDSENDDDDTGDGEDGDDSNHSDDESEEEEDDDEEEEEEVENDDDNENSKKKKTKKKNDSNETEQETPKIDIRMLIVAAELPFAWLLEKSNMKLDKVSEDQEQKTQQEKVTSQKTSKKSMKDIDNAAPEAPLFENAPMFGVFGRNWLPTHRTELATLLETLILWRASDFGREVLMLSGSGGGCDVGLMSTLSLSAGSLNNIEESTLASFAVGPTGDNPSPSNPLMQLNDKEMVANKQNVFNEGKVVFKVGKIIKERNYGLFSFGVFHDPDAPGGTTIKPDKATPQSTNAGLNNLTLADAAKRVGAPPPEDLEEFEEPPGSYLGWWIGEIVPLTEIHFRHPLPGQSSFGVRSERDIGFDGVRAPHWWTQKFPKNSDAVFVDDDIRLLAVENDLYSYLTRTLLKSKYFEACCRDCFNSFNIADIFARDRKLRQCSIEEPTALLKMVKMSICALWNSPLFGDKGRNATSLIGEDDFVLNMVLLHCFEGTRTCFESADNYLVFMRNVFKGAGLAKFASLINDDDEQQIIGKWAIEQTANKAKRMEQEAIALAERQEQERLELLKMSNPGAYQEALADAQVVAKATNIAAEQERQVQKAEETQRKKEAQKRREEAAAVMTAQANKLKRAMIDELNRLAETDPDAYDVAIKDQERRKAEAVAAGRALGPDGEPLLDENSVSGRRQLALRMVGVRTFGHASKFRHLQDQRKRLRRRIAPVFSMPSET